MFEGILSILGVLFIYTMVHEYLLRRMMREEDKPKDKIGDRPVASSTHSR